MKDGLRMQEVEESGACKRALPENNGKVERFSEQGVKTKRGQRGLSVLSMQLRFQFLSRKEFSFLQTLRTLESLYQGLPTLFIDHRSGD